MKHLLVVMVIGEDQHDWTQADHDRLIVRHCCYWLNLEGATAPRKLADAVVGREVSEAVVRTLEAAQEALAHYNSHQSIAAFTAPESQLSFELVVALREIAQDAEESAVRVVWESVGSESQEKEWVFPFTAANVPILDLAATALAAPEPTKPATITGTVHLLTRSEAGGPGVIGLTVTGGAVANKIRVRLGSEDYHRAIDAHDRGAVVTVTGDLEKEGNLTWLYRAKIDDIEAREGSAQSDMLF